MNIYQINNEINARMLELGEILLNGETPSDEQIAEIINLEGDFDNKMVDYHHVIKNLTATKVAFETEIASLNKQKIAIDKQIKTIQERLIGVMKARNKTKAGNDVYSISLVNNPLSVVITDDSKVPSKYKQVQMIEQVKIDKKALKKDHELLQDVDGIQFVQKQRLKLS